MQIFPQSSLNSTVVSINPSPLPSFPRLSNCLLLPELDHLGSKMLPIWKALQSSARAVHYEVHYIAVFWPGKSKQLCNYMMSPWDPFVVQCSSVWHLGSNPPLVIENWVLSKRMFICAIESLAVFLWFLLQRKYKWKCICQSLQLIVKLRKFLAIEINVFSLNSVHVRHGPIPCICGHNFSHMAPSPFWPQDKYFVKWFINFRIIWCKLCK